LVGQQSKQTKKLENSAINLFLAENEPEEQEFSLQKSKFQQILGTACLEFSSVSRFYCLANNKN
jgi:hypothetical protein